MDESESTEDEFDDDAGIDVGYINHRPCDDPSSLMVIGQCLRLHTPPRDGQIEKEEGYQGPPPEGEEGIYLLFCLFFNNEIKNQRFLKIWINTSRIMLHVSPSYVKNTYFILWSPTLDKEKKWKSDDNLDILFLFLFRSYGHCKYKWL